MGPAAILRSSRRPASGVSLGLRKSGTGRYDALPASLRPGPELAAGQFDSPSPSALDLRKADGRPLCALFLSLGQRSEAPLLTLLRRFGVSVSQRICCDRVLCHNSRIWSQLSSHACASTPVGVVPGACCAVESAPAASAVRACSPSSASRSYADVAAACCDVTVAHGRSQQNGSQGPRRKLGTKGWVSRPSKIRPLIPEGQILGWLVMYGGPRPGRRTGSFPKASKALGAVTPSSHLGVPHSLCDTCYTLPFYLDHLSVAWTKRRTKSTSWVPPGHADYVRISMDLEQQSDHNQVTPFGMESWDCGAGSHPF